MSEDASLAAEIETAVSGIRDDLQAAYEAREQALPLCRSAIRHAANCIRAVHRGELERAEGLLEQSRTAVGEAADALRDFPSVFHAGFVHDAQKEYAEASVTLALVDGRPLPVPQQLGVQGPAYLHGLSEAVGELRRYLLDALRRGAIEQCESVLSQMDDIYSMLVTVDYPDAMTGNLRRSTDAARAILERTRGDYTLAVQQERLARRLEQLEPDARS
jgi:translin